MDIYSFVAKNGGQILQDGRVVRQLLSKDGTRVINQFVQKDGSFIMQTFDKANNMLMHHEKNLRADGSFLSKVINYMTGKTQIFAVQRLEEKGSFMSALFKNTNQPIKEGEFLNVISGNISKKGNISLNPVNCGIVSKDNSIYMRTNIFNSKFGKLI